MSKRVCMFTCVCRVWRPEEDVCVLLSFSPLYSLRTGSFPESGAKLVAGSPSHPPVSTPSPRSAGFQDFHSLARHRAWVLWILTLSLLLAQPVLFTF